MLFDTLTHAAAVIGVVSLYTALLVFCFRSLMRAIMQQEEHRD